MTSINSFLKDLNVADNRRKVFLLGAAVLLFIIVSIFLIILPLLHSIRLNSLAIKNQKAILNYVLKYSSKIESVKATAPAGKLAVSGVSAESGKEGYLKFISSLFQYFKIDKSQVYKLYSRYSSSGVAVHASGGKTGKEGAGHGQAEETVFISLKGLSLNQCVNLIYAISHSSGEYGAGIISINMKKNFTNDKLLNLTINIARNGIKRK